MQRHKYRVDITVSVIVTNAESTQEAEEIALHGLDEDWKEYLSEAEKIKVTDLGETGRTK